MVSFSGADHTRVQADGAQSSEEPSMLNFNAAVHDHFETGVARTLGRGVIDHAELHPNNFGFDRNSIVNDSCYGGGFSEYVDDFHGTRDIAQGWIAGPAKNFG